jgi:hypothetical protein
MSRADSIIILVLVFSVITIAIGGIIGDMKNNYDVNASTSWENKYNYANQINTSMSEVQKDIEAVGKETGWLQVLSGASAIWQGTSTTVLIVLSTPGYMVTMIRGIAADMGLPPIVSDVIIPIFIVMIIVVIIFIIIRFVRGENV